MCVCVCVCVQHDLSINNLSPSVTGNKLVKGNVMNGLIIYIVQPTATSVSPINPVTFFSILLFCAVSSRYDHEHNLVRATVRGLRVCWLGSDGGQGRLMVGGLT